MENPCKKNKYISPILWILFFVFVFSPIVFRTTMPTVNKIKTIGLMEMWNATNQLPQIPKTFNSDIVLRQTCDLWNNYSQVNRKILFYFSPGTCSCQLSDGANPEYTNSLDISLFFVMFECGVTVLFACGFFLVKTDKVTRFFAIICVLSMMGSVAVDIYMFRDEYGINHFTFGDTYDMKGTVFVENTTSKVISYPIGFQDQFSFIREICIAGRSRSFYADMFAFVQFETCQEINKYMVNNNYLDVSLCSKVAILFGIIFLGIIKLFVDLELCCFKKEESITWNNLE